MKNLIVLLAGLLIIASLGTVTAFAEDIADNIIVTPPEASEKAPDENAPDENAPDEIIVFVPEGSATTAPIDKYENAKTNVILEYKQSKPEIATDLSTMDKIYEHADIVVVGTVNNIGLGDFRISKYFPYTEVNISCQQMIKGKAEKELAFSFMGGYVPAEKYVENAKQRKGGKATFGFTDEQLKNGYVHVLMSNSPELKKGKQYILFLSRSEDGRLKALPTDNSILTVENGQYKNFEGKTQNLEFIDNTLPHQLEQKSNAPFNITSHGQYELFAKDSVKMDISWSGTNATGCIWQ